MTNWWKVIAIVFIILFIVETTFIMWSVYIVNQETEKTMTCYYDVCGDYPDAYYNPWNELCTCYDTDVLGNPMVGKEKYLG